VAAISGLDAGIAGWRGALAALERAAQRVAPGNADADPAQTMVDLKVAETSAKVSLKVIKTSDEMWGSLLDIFR
jgi:hypothetical protein